MLAQDRLLEHHRFLSHLPPVPCRDELAVFAQAHFARLHRAAEIGVHLGDFARKNLQAWHGEYHAIDAWAHRPEDDASDKNFDDKRQQATYETARLALASFNRTGRVHQIRSRSVAAARRYADESFDWIFIDANHTREAARADLQAWWPKLRQGGLLSGDDYAEQSDTPLLPFSRWLSKGKYAAPIKGSRWGVVSAAQRFAAEKGAILHATYLQDCCAAARLELTQPQALARPVRAARSPPRLSPLAADAYPAWYLVKPPQGAIAVSGEAR